MSEPRILKMQYSFPRLTKKLHEKDKKYYDKYIIGIRLCELQENGMKMIKIGKPTFGGTLITFEPVHTHGEYKDALEAIVKDGEVLGMTFEKVEIEV